MLHIEFSKQLEGARGPFELEANLDLKTQQISVLCGPSGAGKSSFLRVLAGLELVKKGRICFKESVWLDTTQKICLPPQKRPLGFVFQDGALFPHLNVYDNIIFGNPRHQAHIEEVISLMGLEGLLKHPTPMLSGGQVQRVALARALVRILGQPNALLCLDEPLSALDADARAHLQEQLKYISAHFKLTTLIITHDLLEAYKLAHNLIWIEEKPQKHTCLMRDFKTQEGLCARVLEIKGQSVELVLERQIVSLPLNSLQTPQTLKEGDLWVLIPQRAERVDWHL
ncbi:ATP-binding cassette domain-containing protein [Helicobacter mehlei]|uniref:ATP-binding cassette domain-containing protein n=1 Tax=Helicobacter mehlei TaxID=2316080 RepID=A0A553UWZ4_9HELI|nr:ATP-binding cassette domain-containing protein [Helicobacter mehlei]TSA84728.1 ATP-binding cassette domain-containing protein [Helicobacter mehlei]